MNKNLYLFIMTVGIVPVLLISTNSIYAQEENMTESEEPKFFAIQYAESGKFSEINTTTYSLELNNVSDKTILFSDRPDRIVTSVSTADYIGNWTDGLDNFAVDAPNAVLVVVESEKQDTAIITLFNPVYDSEKNVLKYDVIPDNSTSIEFPSEFGQISIIVDNGTIAVEPYEIYVMPNT